jgi:predicted GNAT family N-acyltransferase
VPVRLVKLDGVTHEDWQRIVAGEREPFGGIGETLVWRDKTHHVGVRDDAGQLVAMAGLVLTDVRVADEPMQVAGIGGVIVTKAARGQGLARTMVERLLELAAELGAQRAMLFCLPANMSLYAKLGFQAIDETVSAQQPDGPIAVPMRAMFKVLAGASGWPEGRVELQGEPF